MSEFFRKFWEADSLSPHGICLLWRPELIWTHVVSDLLIAAAYFSIPGALACFVLRRSDVVFGWMFWSFAVFITACGATHLMSVWTLWVPDYGLEALVKAVTALASVATAIALWTLLPKALALPSPGQLRQANEALEARIAERDAALAALEQATAERLQTEALLRQSQKMEALGQLTGGVAHDFNNMLGIMLANMERVEWQLPPDSPLLRHVRNAMTGAERAAALTHKLLAFARKQHLSPVESDLNRLLGDLAELLQSSTGRAVRVETALAPDLPPVALDQNQFENAILNCTVNARDAMPEGGALTLATRFDLLRGEGGSVVVEIRDTGAGMSPEVAAKAFEPFFTTKPLGQGTGLGLSQVFGFVQQSGGSVEIESMPGQGTTIRMAFPALGAALAPTPAPAAGSVAPPQEEGWPAALGVLGQGSGRA